MNTHIRKPSLFLLCLAAAAWAFPAHSATLSVIYNSASNNFSATAVLEGSPGLFYATSGYTIFSVSLQGTATTLAVFKSPPFNIDSNPGAFAANGLLYSSVEHDTSANVFSVSSTAGGAKVYAKQSLGPELAGNQPGGGLLALAFSFTRQPALATVDLKGVVTPLYQFPSSDLPGRPIYGADGNFYGAAGSAYTSYFYRVTPSGAFTQVATLPFVITSYGGGGLLLEGNDGNFYGIQSNGLGCPNSQHGGVYKLTPAGQYTLLHDFGACGIVNSLIEGSDGKLYGTTQYTSVLFSLTKSGVYKVVAALNGTYGLCPCGLLQGSDGKIYGAAYGGGTFGGGTIFALDAGLPVPEPRAPAFYPKSGAVGAKVRIWGYNLFGATVQFNGVAATGVYNSGSNYVWATVPTGATTGPITVTTPGGTVTTKATFTVQ